MSINVFGSPVTNETVRLVYPNLTTPITARHRAQVALLYMHQENRADNVSRFVYNLEPKLSKGASATFGMFYNATGNNLTFHSHHSWSGEVYQTFYPHLIQNGQWAGFFHWEEGWVGPSKEAIVYRGQDEYGSERYWVLAWYTELAGHSPPNRVYTTIEWSQPGGLSYWNSIERYMGTVPNNFNTSTLNRCFSCVTIDPSFRAEFVGIMTLAGVMAGVPVPSLEDDEDSAAAAAAAE